MKEDINVKRDPRSFVDKEREVVFNSRPPMDSEGVSHSIDKANYVSRRLKAQMVEQAEEAVNKKLTTFDVIRARFSEPKASLEISDNDIVSGSVLVTAEFVHGKSKKIGKFTVKIADSKPLIEEEVFSKEMNESKEVVVEETTDTIEQLINDAADSYPEDKESKKTFGTKIEAGISDFDSKDEFMSVPVGTAPESFQKQKNNCPGNYAVGTEVNVGGISYKVSAEDENHSAWIFSKAKKE